MIKTIKKIYQKIYNTMYIKNIYQRTYCHIFIKGASKIQTHLTIEEKFLLHKSIPEKSLCVEIGSYLGASSCCIASSANCQKLYCIDTWENDAMSEGLRDTYAEFQQNTVNFKQKIIPIRARSKEAGAVFKLQIDYLFIDGDHSYTGVKTDIVTWLPKLRSGGIVVMHDSGWAEGVQKVIQEDILSNAYTFHESPNMFIAKMR